MYTENDIIEHCKEALQENTQQVEVNIFIKGLINLTNFPPPENWNSLNEFNKKLELVLKENSDIKQILQETADKLKRDGFMIAHAEAKAKLSEIPVVLKELKKLQFD